MSVPDLHRRFLDRANDVLARDPRVVGVAAGGSLLADAMDEFSDLDLVIAVEPHAFEAVMAERAHIAAALGDLIACFTGEHVGEPRLLICLYGPALLHVDLKFVALADVAARVEDPAVLWEREGRVRAALTGTAHFPEPRLQWIEDRFWIWVHYGAGKIARGELFEALDFLGALRGMVLGPLALASVGARPMGVRKIEQHAPALAQALEATVAGYSRASLFAALRAAIALYRTLRAPRLAEITANARAEAAAVEYLDAIEQRIGRA
jgi:predicted nucleotidyltransferase